MSEQEKKDIKDFNDVINRVIKKAVYNDYKFDNTKYPEGYLEPDNSRAYTGINTTNNLYNPSEKPEAFGGIQTTEDVFPEGEGETVD